MEDLPFADYIFVAIPPERLICSNKYSTLFVIQLWLALHDIPFVGMIPTSKSLYISKYSIFMSVPWHPQIGIHGCWWRTEKKNNHHIHGHEVHIVLDQLGGCCILNRRLESCCFRFVSLIKHRLWTSGSTKIALCRVADLGQLRIPSSMQFKKKRR